MITPKILKAFAVMVAALGGIAIPGVAYTQSLTGVRVETQPLEPGKPLVILVDIDKADNDSITCGAAINFGDGNTRDLRIEGATFPFRVDYIYAAPGTFAVTVEGKTLFRGLRTAGACGGPARSTVTQVGNTGPTVAQPEAASAARTPPAPAAVQNDPTFLLVNRSAGEITTIFVSSAQQREWGRDFLGDKVLRSGQQFKVEPVRDQGCIFDVRVEYPGNRVEERRGQDVCQLEQMVFDGSNARVVQRTQKPADQAGQSGAAPAPSGPQVAGFGTGFFVSGQGHALTNNHVVAGCDRIASVLEGQMVPSIVVQVDRQNDLALVRTQVTRAMPFAKFRAPPGIRVGEDVVAAGFPFPQVLQNGINITRGNVSAMGGIGGNTANMQMTAPVQPGNSGGPLLDSSGNIVGVVVARLSSQAVKSETQNINYAVQGPVARLFLESNGVSPTEVKSIRDVKIGDLSEAAREFTFQIVCFKVR